MCVSGKLLFTGPVCPAVGIQWPVVEPTLLVSLPSPDRCFVKPAGSLPACASELAPFQCSTYCAESEGDMYDAFFSRGRLWRFSALSPRTCAPVTPSVSVINSFYSKCTKTNA